MVARFTAAEGGEERSEFHVLSRRMGNPRLTVWIRLEASYAHVGLPCQLQQRRPNNPPSNQPPHPLPPEWWPHVTRALRSTLFASMWG